MMVSLPPPETMRRLLTQVRGYLSLLDLDKNLRFASRTSHGFEPEKVIGLNFMDFLAPEQRPKAQAGFQHILATGEVLIHEIVFATPSGEEAWLEMRLSPMRDEEGTITGFVNVSIDVTERRRAELALEKTRKELLEASHRAGMAEVATGVLHNIGNVLNSLSVAAHMADDQLQKSRVPLLGEAVGKLALPPDELARFLTEDAQGMKFPRLLRRIADELVAERERLAAEVARVKQQVELMQATIAAQQAFAKTDLFVQEIQLEALIERVLSIFRIEIEGRVIELVTAVQPALVKLDTQSTLQILANLVRNGIEAMEQTGERGGRRKLTVRGGVRDGQVVIEVEDTGCGFAEEVRARLFQHGFTTKPNGHGFGLHSSAIAAQTMGGKLTAHSDGPGRGALFRLTLPERPRADERKSEP
jgi:PAS domain S-box-containing protein